MGAWGRDCPGVSGVQPGSRPHPQGLVGGVPRGAPWSKRCCLGAPGPRDPVEGSLGAQAHATASLPPDPSIQVASSSPFGGSVLLLRGGGGIDSDGDGDAGAGGGDSGGSRDQTGQEMNPL